MIDHCRKEKYGYRPTTYLLATIIAFPCMCLFGPMLMLPVSALMNKNNPGQVVLDIFMAILLFSGLLAPLLMMLNVRRQRNTIRPNINWPDGPHVLPTNSPQKMLPTSVDDDGQLLYEAFEPDADSAQP